MQKRLLRIGIFIMIQIVDNNIKWLFYSFCINRLLTFYLSPYDKEKKKKVIRDIAEMNGS